MGLKWQSKSHSFFAYLLCFTEPTAHYIRFTFPKGEQNEQKRANGVAGNRTSFLGIDCWGLNFHHSLYPRRTFPHGTFLKRRTDNDR